MQHHLPARIISAVDYDDEAISSQHTDILNMNVSHFDQYEFLSDSFLGACFERKNLTIQDPFETVAIDPDRSLTVHSNRLNEYLSTPFELDQLLEKSGLTQNEWPEIDIVRAPMRELFFENKMLDSMDLVQHELLKNKLI